MGQTIEREIFSNEKTEKLSLQDRTHSTGLDKYDNLSKHDRHLEDLRSEIEGMYDHVISNYKIYGDKKKRRAKRQTTKGEIDLLCFKGNEVHAYEVKCSNRVTKARKQLKRIKKSLFHEFARIDEIKTFFYCGSAGTIEEMVLE